MKLKIMSAFVAFVLAVCSVASVATANGLRFVEFPATVPTTEAAISIHDTCENRSAVLGLLQRLRIQSDDAVFKSIDYGGHRYVAFNLKQAGVSLPMLASCVDLHFGNADQARHTGLWVPGPDTAEGVFLFTPTLGFYGDPRTVHLLGKKP